MNSETIPDTDRVLFDVCPAAMQVGIPTTDFFTEGDEHSAAFVADYLVAEYERGGLGALLSDFDLFGCIELCIQVKGSDGMYTEARVGYEPFTSRLRVLS